MDLGDRMQINMVMRVDHKKSERPMTPRNRCERSGASPQSVYMPGGTHQETGEEEDQSQNLASYYRITESSRSKGYLFQLINSSTIPTPKLSLGATSRLLLDTARDGDSTIALGILIQCLAIFSVNIFL